MTWWRQAAGSFFAFSAEKESEVEVITHIFLRFSGSDTAASWSDYEVEKPDTLYECRIIGNQCKT